MVRSLYEHLIGSQWGCADSRSGHFIDDLLLLLLRLPEVWACYK